MLAFGAVFSMGSLASTIGIHYIFGPYVYRIEKKKNENDSDSEKSANATTTSSLHILTRSLFLLPITTVTTSCPENDLLPYNGLRPLCNFSMNDKPFYVHPEYLHDAGLRTILHLDKHKEEGLTQEDGKIHSRPNPDDELF